MNCLEIQELLSAYYDSELTDDRLSRLSEHIDGCSNCALKLAKFSQLSNMASVLSTPPTPADMWDRLEQQLDHSMLDSQPSTKLADETLRRSFPVPRLFALAATLLLAVGITWYAYQAWSPLDENAQFTVDFGNYLEMFRRDPDAAQQLLLANYENQLVSPGHAIQQVGYRPAVAGGLPGGYDLESTYVIKMPCCLCVQSNCKRSDGSTLAIFEHDDEETTEWFGDRPEITVSCHNKRCCLVELDDQIAASWKRGTRHITLIGVRDVAEVSRMIAWLEDKNRIVPNERL